MFCWPAACGLRTRPRQELGQPGAVELLAGDQLSQEDDLDGASGLLIQGISRMITECPPDEDLASVWINVLAARGLLADGGDKPDHVRARPCRGEPVAGC